MSMTTPSSILGRVVRGQRTALHNSTLGHARSIEELYDVWTECKIPGWDGYNAFPVDQDTYSAAFQLIESLPLGFPRPTIGAEPDGQISLEWRFSTKRILSVSVDPDGYIHYAGLFGTDKKYGTLAFYSEAPAELLQMVERL